MRDSSIHGQIYQSREGVGRGGGLGAKSIYSTGGQDTLLIGDKNIQGLINKNEPGNFEEYFVCRGKGREILNSFIYKKS